MRHFQIGDGENRKFVVLEVQGSRVRIVKGNADGTNQRSEKALADETTAEAACDQLARKLIAQGYVERSSKRPGKVKVASPAFDFLNDAGEDSAEKVESLPPRLAPAAVAEPKKKSPGKKKKKKAAEGGDELDRRVIAGMLAAVLVGVGFLGFLGYRAFLKPASIVGNWEGSRTEHEIGKFLTNTQYKLILDDQKRASLSIQNGSPFQGTYELRGDRLTLALKDEEGESTELRYKIALDSATLDLFDAQTGKKVVQLIRFRKKPVVGGGAPPADAPQEVAAGPADKAEDARLASVSFAVKDGAFSLRHPPGWEMETGSRPDNSYSWARFTQGSARIQVFADVAGSLVAGPNSTDHEEGSAAAPVHGAHTSYQRQAAELYSDYKESEPATFKGSALGEGRISTFSATGGGVFGSKLKGIRVTLLTNDRRISILCEVPASQFEKMKPTFLAVCRSLSR